MGFEPTPPKRLELESSALDRSATEPERVQWSRFMIYYALCNGYVKKKVLPGFEPTPPKRLELESSALDHSATEPRYATH